MGAIANIIKNAKEKDMLISLTPEQISDYFKADDDTRNSMFSGNVRKVLKAVEEEIKGVTTNTVGRFLDQDLDLVYQISEIIDGKEQTYDFNLHSNNSFLEQWQQLALHNDHIKNVEKQAQEQNVEQSAAQPAKEQPETEKVAEGETKEQNVITGNKAFWGVVNSSRKQQGQSINGYTIDNIKIVGKEKTTVIDGVDFSGVTFGNNVKFDNVLFVNCKFNDATFKDKVALSNVEFANCSMIGSVIPKRVVQDKDCRFINSQGEPSSYRDVKMPETAEVKPVVLSQSPSENFARHLDDTTNKLSELVQSIIRYGISPELNQQLTTMLAEVSQCKQMAEKIVGNMEEKGVLSQEYGEAIDEHVDEIDEKIEEGLSEANKAEVAKAEEVFVGEVDKQGNVIDKTQEEAQHAHENSVECAKTSGELFKEFSKQLTVEMKDFIKEGLAAIKRNTVGRLQHNRDLSRQAINEKMDPQIQEAAAALAKATRELAQDIAKEDFDKGESKINGDGSVDYVKLFSSERGQIDRLKERVSDLIVKKADLLMKPINSEIKMYSRDQRADAASQMLTVHITNAMQAHPEVFKNGHFVLNNNLTMDVTIKNNKMFVDIDRGGQISQISLKQFNGTSILDFSPYLSQKEKEAFMKAIIEDCEVQEPQVKAVLGHSYSLHRQDPAFATISDTFDDVYKKSMEVMTEYEQKLSDIRDGNDVANHMEDAGENREDVGDEQEDIGDDL